MDQSHIRQDITAERGSLLLYVFSISVAAIGVNYAFTWRGVIVAYLYENIGSYWTKAIISSSVLATGWIAYRFKKKRQILYGLCEVIFAATSAVHVVGRLAPGMEVPVQWGALIGFAYVVARGLGNISDGKEKLFQKALKSQTK